MFTTDIKINDLHGKTVLCFDLETIGLPICKKDSKYKYFSPTDNSKYQSSRIVQIAWAS